MTASSDTLAEAIAGLAAKAHKCFDAPPLHSCHHYRLALAERITECIADAIDTHRGWRAAARPRSHRREPSTARSKEAFA